MPDTPNSKQWVILTGATGYLGQRLIPLLVAKKYKLICPFRRKTDRSFIDTPDILWMPFSKDKMNALFDSISHVSKMIAGTIHTATCYGRANETIEEIKWANIGLPTCFLNFASRTQHKWFLNIDSCLPSKLNAYAATKATFRSVLNESEFTGTKVNVPLQQFFGANDNQLISRVIGQFRSNITEILCSDGAQKRDFIYIDDVIEAFDVILDTLATDYKHETSLEFPIGTGSPIPLRLALETVKYLSGSKTHLNFGALSRRQEEPDLLSYGSEKLRSLGWAPKYSFEDGIKKVLSEIN